MKKIVMTAVASSIMLANFVMADTDVYGKINLSLNSVQAEENGDDTLDSIEVVSHASRLGFKGDIDITDNLKALAKIEYQVAADGDLFDLDKDGVNDSPFKARNVYVGVEGNWGQAIAGRKDTPYKTLGKKADQFNDYFLGDIGSLVTGEERVSNMIQYKTPTMAGVTVAIMGVAGEESGIDETSTGGNKNDKNGIDGFSGVVDYKLATFSVGLGLDSDIDGLDGVRLAADWKIAGFKFGALVQKSEESDSNAAQSDQTGVVVSASYKLENWIFKAQYGMSETDKGFDKDYEGSLATIGADYKLSKTTKVYGYLSQLDEKAYDVASAKTDETSQTLGLGLEHKF